MTRRRLVAALTPIFWTRAAATPRVRESRIPIAGASLYSREIGRGRPIIVLHGGPDFDHRYLLPDLDRLSANFRLIYFDQRGRGASAQGIEPEEITIASELEDLDRVRRYYGLRSPALLGHSWGAVLALEYALRHPGRVSRIILMNPAPVSAAGLALFRKAYAASMGADLGRQREIVSGAAYQAGDPQAVGDRYRLHFKPAFARAAEYEKLMAAMKAAFAAQGREGILKARAVEARLMRETWDRKDYDLLPQLRRLNVPVLLIAGDHDFIPVDVAEQIAHALPRARLATLQSCGHFAYLERPGEVRRVIVHFFESDAAQKPVY